MEECVKLDLNTYHKLLERERTTDEKLKQLNSLEVLRAEVSHYKEIIKNLNDDLTLFMYPKGVVGKIDKYQIGWVTKDKAVGLLLNKFPELAEKSFIREPNYKQELDKIPKWIRRIFK